MSTKRRKPRPGLPARESVVEEKVFLSPKGTTYRILRTNEVDGYEEGRYEEGRKEEGGKRKEKAK